MPIIKSTVKAVHPGSNSETADVLTEAKDV